LTYRVPVGLSPEICMTTGVLPVRAKCELVGGSV
jgi:hypothetical protein